MPTLAWIDDNSGLRESYLHQVRAYLPKGWVPLVAAPLATVDEYHKWIHDNEISLLLLDERLGDKTSTGKSHVQYRGHDVIRALRRRLPEFPVFMITAFPDDLAEDEGEVDGVVEKREFQKHFSAYMDRFLRATMRYRERKQQELVLLSKLSTAVARGTATKSQKDEIRALQECLVASVPNEATIRTDVLDKMQERLQQLESLCKQLNEVLKSDHGRGSKRKAKK